MSSTLKKQTYDFFCTRRRGDIKLHLASESLTIQDNFAALHDFEPQAYSLIDGNPGHQTVLVIHIGA